MQQVRNLRTVRTVAPRYKRRSLFGGKPELARPASKRLCQRPAPVRTRARNVFGYHIEELTVQIHEIVTVIRYEFQRGASALERVALDLLRIPEVSAPIVEDSEQISRALATNKEPQISALRTKDKPCARIAFCAQSRNLGFRYKRLPLGNAYVEVPFRDRVIRRHKIPVRRKLFRRSVSVEQTVTVHRQRRIARNRAVVGYRDLYRDGKISVAFRIQIIRTHGKHRRKRNALPREYLFPAYVRNRNHSFFVSVRNDSHNAIRINYRHFVIPGDDERCDEIPVFRHRFHCASVDHNRQRNLFLYGDFDLYRVAEHDFSVGDRLAVYRNRCMGGRRDFRLQQRFDCTFVREIIPRDKFRSVFGSKPELARPASKRLCQRPAPVRTRARNVFGYHIEELTVQIHEIVTVIRYEFQRGASALERVALDLLRIPEVSAPIVENPKQIIRAFTANEEPQIILRARAEQNARPRIAD